MDVVSPSLRKAFERAGWHPGRIVAVEGSVPEDHPAHAILSMFGGLSVGGTGRGSECATGDIRFGELDNLYPEAIALSAMLGETIVGIGELHDRYAQLCISQSGRCFDISMLDPTVCLQGGTFEAAMLSLLTGTRAMPILLPGQESVTLYGQTYLPGDPALWALGVRPRSP